MNDFDIEKYHHYDDDNDETKEPEAENPTKPQNSDDGTQNKLYESENNESSIPTEFEDVYSGIEDRESLIGKSFEIDGSKENDSFVVHKINNEDFVIDGDSELDGKKKRKKGKKAILITSVAIVTVLAIVLASVFFAGKHLLGKIQIDKNPNSNVFVNDADMITFPDVYNVLLIGADDLEETDGDYSRSDSMILMSLDSINKKIKLTSFMRDSYVAIPGKASKDRLNSAYKEGGQQLAMDTLEYNFGINIDAYVVVSFKTFVDAIEKLGGINVDITAKEAKYIQKIAPHIKSGSDILLDGEEALLYARIRYVDSDFNRTARQRKIIEALIDKAKSSNPITIVNMAFQIAGDIKTNISQKEISKLAASSTTYATYDVEQFRIPADDTYKDASVIINKLPSQILDIDVAKNKEKLFEFIYPQEAAKTTTLTTSKTTTEKASN